MSGYARPVALAVIRDGDEIFVFEGRHPVTGEIFYRPLGGTIEYGERASDAVKRELQEEAGATVSEARLLTVLENIFPWEHGLAHEVVFVFDVRVADHERLRGGPIEAFEANGERLVCAWKPLAAFRGGAKLVPDGLLALLEGGARP